MGALLMLSLGPFVTPTVSMVPPTPLFLVLCHPTLPFVTPTPLLNLRLAIRCHFQPGVSIRVVIGSGCRQSALPAAVALLDVGAITLPSTYSNNAFSILCGKVSLRPGVLRPFRNLVLLARTADLVM